MRIENIDYEMSIKRHNKCLESFQEALLNMKNIYKSSNTSFINNEYFDVNMFISYVPLHQCLFQSNLITINDLYSNLYDIYKENNDDIEIFIRFVTSKISSKYFFCEAFKYESENNLTIYKFRKTESGKYYTDFCFKYGYNNIDNVLNTLLKSMQSILTYKIQH